jgi:hypothetical protein
VGVTAVRFAGRGILQVVAVAWVGDNGQGAFSAWVDYDDPGPFSYRHGPSDVPLADALFWARAQSPRVILRVGDVHYSAGEEQAGGKPVWTHEVATPASAAGNTGSIVGWRVDARVCWFRVDREAVAMELTRAIERDPRAADAAMTLRVPEFSVRFALRARSELDAHELASEILQSAWSALDAHADPGEDFDGPSMSVTPA